jgi:hypothetical protein
MSASPSGAGRIRALDGLDRSFRRRVIDLAPTAATVTLTVTVNRWTQRPATPTRCRGWLFHPDEHSLQQGPSTPMSLNSIPPGIDDRSTTIRGSFKERAPTAVPDFGIYQRTANHWACLGLRQSSPPRSGKEHGLRPRFPTALSGHRLRRSVGPLSRDRTCSNGG